MECPVIGNVILIVGTSSVGKSSTVQELQSALADHYLALGIDTFLHMVSPRWGGGMAGPLSVEGFHYVRTTINDTPIIRIEYGDVGWRVLKGMHRAVAALALSGNNIIVDEMLLDEDVLHDWAHSLRDIPVCVVRLRASLTALEQREHQRGDRSPPGLARGHLGDNLIANYDIDLDTTNLQPSQIASAIAQYMEFNTAWRALQSIAQTQDPER